MENKTLTKTQKRKLLFEQTCKFITTLGFDGPHDDDGYGRINFEHSDENIHLELQRSSMSLCSSKLNWDEGTNGFPNDSSQSKLEAKIEDFIGLQKIALDLNI